MCPHVPFQLVGVSAGVAAKAALEGPFACVGPDVSFQLAHLKRRPLLETQWEDLQESGRASATSGRQPTSTLQ